MKYRIGFVSNSSSSSFLGHGFSLDDDNLYKTVISLREKGFFKDIVNEYKINKKIIECLENEKDSIKVSDAFLELIERLGLTWVNGTYAFSILRPIGPWSSEDELIQLIQKEKANPHKGMIKLAKCLDVKVNIISNSHGD